METEKVKLEAGQFLGDQSEPFCGGAALFFNLRPTRSLLADTNVELINAYAQIRDNPEALIDRLSRLSNSESTYYLLRNRSPRTPITRAVRFIYLTRLSFNGIYRENLRGEFNVPYGYKTQFPVSDPVAIRCASRALAQATLRCQDFRLSLAQCEPGDLVYVDPPYTVAHNNNGFIKYNQKLFSWQDQLSLASACRRARDRGAYILISNADHAEIIDLYAGFQHVRITRFSPISGLPKGRKHVTEALFIGEPQ